MNEDPEQKGNQTGWLDEDILRRLIERNPIDNVSKGIDKVYVPTEIRGRVSKEHLWLLIAEFNKIQAKAGNATKVNLLNLRLSASGYPGLFDYILKTGEFFVGNFHRAVRLLDFGAESFVFIGADRTEMPVAIKIPFLDYTNLKHLETDQLLRRRRRLVHEETMLRVLEGTQLPRFISSYVGRNPLFPSGIPSFLTDSEQFLIMEYLRGSRLDHLTRTLHQRERGCCVARLAMKFAGTFFVLSEEIVTRLGPHAVYTDIKPENALVQKTEIRIVDASSIIVSTKASKPTSFSITEAYLDPIDHQEWKIGRFVPRPAFIVRSVVRIVSALIANTPLFIGRPSPAYTSSPLVEQVSNFYALASDLNVELRRATEVAHTLLDRLTCQHGDNVFSDHGSV